MTNTPSYYVMANMANRYSYQGRIYKFIEYTSLLIYWLRAIRLQSVREWETDTDFWLFTYLYPVSRYPPFTFCLITWYLNIPQGLKDVHSKVWKNKISWFLNYPPLAYRGKNRELRHESTWMTTLKNCAKYFYFPWKKWCQHFPL